MSNCNFESEMVQLFRRAQAGDRRCLNRLMRQHDGLVHHSIRQQWDGPLTYAETLQEGRMALWRAILGSDPERGTAFSTYASVAIARQVWRAVKRAQKDQQDDLAFLAPLPFLIHGTWFCKRRSKRPAMPWSSDSRGSDAGSSVSITASMVGVGTAWPR